MQAIEESRDVWNQGAAAYRSQAEQVSFYRATNAALLEGLSLTPASRVMDLACGSASLILRALLEQPLTCPRVLYGVDASEAMIDLARETFAGADVRFVVARAEEVGEVVAQKFDNVFCNSALFLTDVPASLSSVRSLLAPGGTFHFTLAEWQADADRGQQHPRYDAINAELKARGLPLKEQRGSPFRYSNADVAELLQGAGLRLESVRTLDVAVSAEDWARFYGIPSFPMMSLPHLGLDLALEVLQAAMGRLRGVQLPDVRWYVFRATQA